jgi:NAD(P)-dependent dehydrogenase (short-subunit alcohol dehydrogenase family)
VKAFENKVVVLTGAASGLGRELALQLSGLGARLALIDVDAGGMETTVAACLGRSADVKVLSFICDVTDRSRLRELAATVARDFGGVDYLFANAGRTCLVDVTRLDEPLNEQVLTTNMLGTVRTIEAFLPSMLAQKSGHVIGVGSLAGLRGLPKGAYYCASKAAQAVFLEGLRFDVKKHGIRVSSVLPGFMDTPMNAPLLERYRMLPMMPVDRAARRLLRAVARGTKTIVFPKRLHLLAALNHLVPKWVSDPVIARLHKVVERRDKPAPAPSDEATLETTSGKVA